jgi:4-diphosphocytidyl-2-C-methyl-D-erythritol kinase
VSKISVPTASIYKEWDKLRNFKLTKPKYGVNILNLALRRHDLPLIRECLFNGLEEVTTKLYPQALRAKERLFSLGVQSILMSGSGPAMFCVVSSRKEALSLSRQLGKKEKSLRVFVTGTF